MSIWSRIKSWLAPATPEERIDLEDRMRGADFDEFDDEPLQCGCVDDIGVWVGRPEKTDPQIPALFRARSKKD